VRGFFLGILFVFVVAIVTGLALIRQSRGFSTREQATPMERWVARKAREIAMPGDAKSRRNPVANSPEVIADGRAHWADHCASCHANDGSGETVVGKNLYPPAPDMREAATQQLSDGELYYIIHNGIRWTGMPAWGASDYDPETWQLVHFIRHLPNLTKPEIQEMEHYNPQSTAEREEQEQEQKFLNGDAPPNDKEKK